MTEPKPKRDERDVDLQRRAERAYEKLQRIRSKGTSTELGDILAEEEIASLRDYFFGALDRWFRSPDNSLTQISLRQQATDFLFKELSDPPAEATPIVRRMQEIKEKYRARPPELPLEIIQLPLWPEEAPGMPNALIRSALFPAIKSKDRQWLNQEKIEGVAGVEIIFTGEQWNQQDFDVAREVYNIARNSPPLGTVCHTTPYGLLKKLQWATGKEQYTQLHQSLLRLSNSIRITGPRFQFFGSILKGIYDQLTSQYQITVAPEVSTLFNQGWTRIAREIRRKLRSKELALWLQANYASHRNPSTHPYSIKLLHKLSGSRTQALGSFKQNLGEALEELKAIGVIAEWDIDDSDKVHVYKVRTISDGQK